MSVDEAPQPPVPVEASLDGVLGIETLVIEEDVARSRLEITDAARQPFGLVHGGAYAAMAESLASRATVAGVWDDGFIAVGMSNATSFMRPATKGTLHAEARRRHRGRTTWIWDVDMTDDDGRLCASARITMAVRPRPDA